MARPALLLGGYAVVVIVVLLLVGPRLSREIFPSAAANQFRLRFDAPDGTRVGGNRGDGAASCSIRFIARRDPAMLP